jgi:hypothetical protein
MEYREPALETHHLLKEWAVAVDALGRGEAILTVRKGGIREEAREFRMEHRRFAFFPTFEHQHADQLRPEFRARLSPVAAGTPSASVLRIDTWAEVSDVLEVQEAASVQALSRFYVFSERYALERLQWRPKKPLHVLLLRVYRLPAAVEMPLAPGFGGCRSWITLPVPIDLAGSDAVLDDAAYQALRRSVLEALDRPSSRAE